MASPAVRKGEPLHWENVYMRCCWKVGICTCGRPRYGTESERKGREREMKKHPEHFEPPPTQNFWLRHWFSKFNFRRVIAFKMLMLYVKTNPWKALIEIVQFWWRWVDAVTSVNLFRFTRVYFKRNNRINIWYLQKFHHDANITASKCKMVRKRNYYIVIP